VSAPEYVVVELEPGKAILLKLKHEGGLVYQRVASGPASLVLESIAETLNKEAEAEAREREEAEAREVQLDAMVIHHEAGAERAPELHADRTGREAYLEEGRAEAAGRVRGEAIGRLLGDRVRRDIAEGNARRIGFNSM
jgi:hypothetical protein